MIDGTDERTLHGWGRTSPRKALVAAANGTPANLEQLTAAFAGEHSGATGRGVIPRGLGRSYGDAAQRAGGLVIDCTALDGAIRLDGRTGTVRVPAGISIAELLSTSIPRGWFLPVTPGTRHVTIGGAIAADVHGKNHHRDGSFSRHVDRFTLLTPAGEAHDVTRDDDLFGATMGGMGLTGIILDADIRMLPVSTSWMRVSTERFASLDGLMERMQATDEHHRYSVAWVDLGPGSNGRSVLQQGDHASLDELPQGKRYRSSSEGRVLVNVPSSLPRVVNRATVRAFNELWFRKAPSRPRTSFERASSFFYPLDAVGAWNHLYGPKGFLQYQFVVPFAREDVLLDAIGRLVHGPVPVSLAVLKRFGPQEGGPLAFPIEGWTLAADMPAGDPELGNHLDLIDVIVAGAGGRVYLAKDSRTRRDAFSAMYPRLCDWRAVKARVDPRGLFRSDLSVRLGLTDD